MNVTLCPPTANSGGVTMKFRSQGITGLPSKEHMKEVRLLEGMQRISVCPGRAVALQNTRSLNEVKFRMYVSIVKLSVTVKEKTCSPGSKSFGSRVMFKSPTVRVCYKSILLCMCTTLNTSTVPYIQFCSGGNDPKSREHNIDTSLFWTVQYTFMGASWDAWEGWHCSPIGGLSVGNGVCWF